MPADVVVVLTGPGDVTSDRVITELNRRGCPVLRLDPGDFPRHVTLAATMAAGWTGMIDYGGRQLDLHDVRSVYCRRPTGFGFPDEMDSQVRLWAEREARFGLGGVIATLPGWLNHPHRIGYAEYKPVQLHAATAADLAVPPTLITNSVTAAQRFAEQVGAVVYKPLHGGGITEEGQWKSPYATPVSPSEIADASVELTAHLFQQRQIKAYEVRLTVVDHEMFPAEIHAGSDAAKVDWRLDYGSLTYRAGIVPAPIRHAVRRMMDNLDLRFGALDFVVTPAGNWIFLELNPNGQWAWLQDETGLPITEAIVDALQGGRP